MKKNLSVPFNDLNAQHNKIKNKINSAINSVITSNSFIRGTYVKNFENKFSKMYDNYNCISCGNGTDAIYLALKTLNINKGDEVIVPAISWISSSETVSQSGARVCFADVDNDCLIDTDKIENLITHKTKAIIVVHLYGKPCDMTRIMKIAKKYKLYVIEDCAQAHFAEWKGQKVGTFGIFGTFSFYPGKNIGAIGDAGCIITKNKSFAKKIRALANHGSSVKNKHDHIYEGINSRMDGIQAAILSIKLNYIIEWNKKRNTIANKYFEYLKNNKKIILPIQNKFEKNVYHLFVIKIKNRNYLIKKLKENSISWGIHYPRALPNLTAYKYLNTKKIDKKNASFLEKKILSIPIYPELKNWQIKKVCEIINKYAL